MPQDNSCQNLRGHSFKGQDLAGANFTYADIRGADFSEVNLRGANFNHPKAGLQPYQQKKITITNCFFSSCDRRLPCHHPHYSKATGITFNFLKLFKQPISTLY